MVEMVMPVTRDQAGAARVVLPADAIVSAVFGAICLAFVRPIDRFLGLDAPVVAMALGVVSLLYAAVLFWLTRQPLLTRGQVMVPAFLNTAWVAVTAVMLATGQPDLTTTGSWVIAIVADGAGALATAQWLALRRIA